jgi:hypothetical protein
MSGIVGCAKIEWGGGFCGDFWKTFGLLAWSMTKDGWNPSKLPVKVCWEELLEEGDPTK